MAEMWFYTCEGKQMDPVTIKELKRLVGDGTLKPTDMIWKDGMPRWIRASSLKELFPDPTSSLDQFFMTSKDESKQALAPPPAAPAGKPSAEAAPAKPASAPAADAPQEKKRPRPSDSAADEDRPPRRRPEGPGGKSSMGIIIVLAFGALVLLGALIGGVAIILIFVTRPGEQKAPVGDDRQKKGNLADAINGEVKYDLQIPPGESRSRTFSFRQGVAYDITVLSQPAVPGVNVDLLIYHPRNGGVEKADTRPARDCFLNFSPREDGDYRVEVKNVAGGREVKASVTIKEGNQAGNEPLPKGVLEGRDSKDTPLLTPGESFTFKFRVKEGYAATISATVIGSKLGADINITVVKENEPNVVIKSDMRPDAHARVSFTLPAQEIVRVQIINASTKVTSKCSIIYDVSPP